MNRAFNSNAAVMYLLLDRKNENIRANLKIELLKDVMIQSGLDILFEWKKIDFGSEQG